MERVYSSMKELYEQVSEVEYNRINPYDKTRETILNKYPKAKILSTKTETIVIGSLYIPMLVMKFETNTPS